MCNFTMQCLVFVMLLCLFIAALWSPRERADLLALACDVYCDFVIFPFGILGQVWYWIVLIPDLCCLSYLAYIYQHCSSLKWSIVLD